MKREINLCLSCMGKLDENGGCPICGRYDKDSYISSYLAPETFLAQRYVVGKLIHYCGESALYIGFDTEEDRKITIREYMPDTLCVRSKYEEAVTVKPEKLPLYKTYLAEFIDLHTTLMNSGNIRCVQPVLDVFTENGTAYAVMDYIGGITLKAYLANCGEVMTWEQVKELFPPVLTALSMLHGMGIIHRGISTSTIVVSEKNERKLIGFSISAAHTVDSDIGYEVFGGFAAPEQYSSNRRNGSWTDVYGISAVLYRCLTGITPPTAPERLADDALTEPVLINRNIPHNVSDVIMKGLRLEAGDRISTVSELVDRLFEQPLPAKDISAEIAVPIKKASAASVQKNAGANKKSSPKKNESKKSKIEKDKLKFIIITSILGAIIIAFLLAIIIPAASEQEEEPAQTTAVTTAKTTAASSVTTPAEEDGDGESTASNITEGYLVPSFVGSLYSTVSNSSQYSYLIFNATYEFNDEYKSGQIISQDIEEGTAVSSGTEINVTVSKGPKSIPLPEYADMSVEDYVKTLSELGIKYRTEGEESSEVKEGFVVRCSKEVGEGVDVESSEEVVVYFALTPEETTAETSDTAAPEETSEPEETQETESEGADASEEDIIQEIFD